MADRIVMKSNGARGGLRAALLSVLAVLMLLPVSRQAVGGGGLPIAADGIHDPTGPAINELQEPTEGLAGLPEDTIGNKVRWVHALQGGAISPRRSRTLPETPVQVLDMDVLLNLRGSAQIVRFPHLAHTQWLACNNCHEELFKSQIGANNIRMANILAGEQCGRCHGAVSFPLTLCSRCHSVPRPKDIYVNTLPANSLPEEE